MAYLLDTCVISSFGNLTATTALATWMSGIQPDEAYLSVLTLGEIRAESSCIGPRMPGGRRTRTLAGWIEVHYAERILPVTAAVADRWADWSLNQPLPVSGRIDRRHGA